MTLIDAIRAQQRYCKSSLHIPRKKPRKFLTPEDIVRIKKLRLQGLTIPKIATELDYSVTTVKVALSKR